MKKIVLFLSILFLLNANDTAKLENSVAQKSCEENKQLCDPDLIDEYIAKAREYLNGEGVERDKQKAREFFEKAKQLFNKTYDEITIKEYLRDAKRYYYGDDGEKIDKFKAKDLLEIVCDADNMEGCTLLGLIYATGDGARQDIQKAKDLYGKACDGRYMKGCEGYRILNEAGF